MNLNDLSGSVAGSTPDRRRSVRKVGRLQDLKKESPVSARRSRGSGHLSDSIPASPRRSRGSGHGNILDRLEEQPREQEQAMAHGYGHAPISNLWASTGYFRPIDHGEVDLESEQRYEGSEFHDAVSAQYSHTGGFDVSPQTNKSGSVCVSYNPGELVWKGANSDGPGTYTGLGIRQDHELRQSRNVEVNSRAARMGLGMVESGMGSRSGLGLEVEMAGGWI